MSAALATARAPSTRLGEVWRQDFQTFHQLAMGPGGASAPLAFLDSAASAQKPEAVMEAMAHALEGPYANIHRGLYQRSQASTTAFEEARQTVAQFLGHTADGIVFTRNSTEAINLVAHSWGHSNLKKGDVIILTALEHHANIVPWQILRDELGLTIIVADIEDDGSLPTANVEKAFKAAKGKAKLLAITQMSNVLGTQPDLKAILKLAKLQGATTLVDGSQGAVHGPQNLKQLGADFYVCTGHKLYGPTGIGVLAASPDLLNAMPPYQGGGDMIESVTFEKTTFAKAPARFEAGTPAFVEAIGLAAALNYMHKLGWAHIQKHENALATYLHTSLENVPGVIKYNQSSPIAAFNLLGKGGKMVNQQDVATILDQHNVAVRSGHLCAMPLMKRLGITGCLRASLGLYNTKDDVDQLVQGLLKARTLLGK